MSSQSGFFIRHLCISQKNKVKLGNLKSPVFPEWLSFKCKAFADSYRELQQPFFVCFSATASVAKILNAKPVTAQTQCQTDQVLKDVFFIFYFEDLLSQK